MSLLLSVVSFVVGLTTEQRDKGSRRVKRQLPPEYRWPQPTPEQPNPLADVVLQAQIQGVALPKNPAFAMALCKATERRPIRQKVIEKTITDDEDDEDLFLLT